MDEYIRKNDALEVLRNILTPNKSCAQREMILTAGLRIRKLKPIGPEDIVPHGKWIGMGYEGYIDGNPVYDYWECSVCRNGEDGEDVPDKNPYCRHCGAKMDK